MSQTTTGNAPVTSAETPSDGFPWRIAIPIILGIIVALCVIIGLYSKYASDSPSSAKNSTEKSSSPKRKSSAPEDILTISAKRYLKDKSSTAIPITEECIIDQDAPNTMMGHTGDIIFDGKLYKDGEPFPLMYKRLYKVEPVKNSFIIFTKTTD